MKYLTFEEVANPDRKTKRWVIKGSGGLTIGWIEFHAPWRKYVWSMVPGSIFDVNCTTEVVQFLRDHGSDRQEA